MFARNVTVAKSSRAVAMRNRQKQMEDGRVCVCACVCFMMSGNQRWRGCSERVEIGNIFWRTVPLNVWREEEREQRECETGRLCCGFSAQRLILRPVKVLMA